MAIIFRGGSVKKLALDQKKINEEINQYIRKLDSFTEEELCKIHSVLSGYIWPLSLGEHPKEWGSLPNEPKSLNTCIWKYIKTKSRITRPIMKEIEEMIGNSKLLEWHWIQYCANERTDYEKWILKEKINRYKRY